jgi:putative pyruvate formate lyase activating enzyme
MINSEPGFLSLHRSGVLQQRAEIALSHLSACDVCAWKCRINRLNGEHGACKTGSQAIISSFGAHHGEEIPISGWRGSGTIFFANCNLRCQYCQNHDISQTNIGDEVNAKQLAAIMLELQAEGAHNINLVSPSHVVPQIIAALSVAAAEGLHIPIVYNTGGYDSVETLRLLDGLVDIYMPDMKYADAGKSLRYSKAVNYPAVNKAAVKEMHRQVGDLQIDGNGLAWKGLLVRHLILPGNLAGTEKTAKFLAEEISPNTYLNLMQQYHPAYNAHKFPEIDRLITGKEYEEAAHAAQAAGLTRFDKVCSPFWLIV